MTTHFQEINLPLVLYLSGKMKTQLGKETFFSGFKSQFDPLGQNQRGVPGRLSSGFSSAPPLRSGHLPSRAVFCLPPGNLGRGGGQV